MSIDYLLNGDPQEKIRWQGHVTMYGRPVYGSRRSIAHLEYTNQRSLKKFNEEIGIIQSAYNSGVEASAGTHDFDATYDTYIAGVDWWSQQRFFRECGWAAWYRYPPAFGRHIHMISLGYNTRVGIYVPGQVNDYYRRALGLKGQHNTGADTSWFPPDIDKTVFDYGAWKKKEQDDMANADEVLKVLKDFRGDFNDFQKLMKAREERTLKWRKEFRAAIGRRFNATDAQLDEIEAEIDRKVEEEK